MSGQIYLRLSDESRRSAIAREGRDPGEVSTIDLSGASPEDREAIASAITHHDLRAAAAYGDTDFDRALRGAGASGGARVAVLDVRQTGAIDSTPSAIAAAIRTHRATEARRAAEAARATAERVAINRARWEQRARAFLADETERSTPSTYDCGDLSRDPLYIEVERAAAERKAADEAAQRAREEEVIAAFLADPAARAYKIGYDSVDLAADGGGVRIGGRESVAYVEAKRRETADNEAKAAAERTRTICKLAYLCDWIREHGSDDMRERQAAGIEDKQYLGYVPEAEVLDAVREHVFAPLADEPRYRKISTTELDDQIPDGIDEDQDRYYGGGYRHRKDDMDCTTGLETEIEPAQWVQLKAIRAKAPAGAKVELRWHECSCTTKSCAWGSDCHSVVRHGILVTVAVTEGLDLAREYAC